jgi:hypothetical protein
VLVAHGRIVQRGRHSDLLADDDRLYARQYASWLEQTPSKSCARCVDESEYDCYFPVE